MELDTSDCETWASDMFGQVELGDVRRTRRLVSIAASLARAPSGAVMASIQDPAEREGAFRFLASDTFDVDELSDGICASTLRRCSGLTYCPVDGASISLSDDGRSRDIGGVGSWRKGGRGLHAVTMLAADRNGAPVGILGAQWWARTEPSLKEKHRNMRSLPTEMRHVLAALSRVEQVRDAVGTGAQLWFQLDRGFDAWPVFHLAQEQGLLITVRSSTDRRILTPNGSARLYPTVESARKLGTFTVRIPERPKRPQRDATLSVRVAPVQLLLQVGRRRTEVVPVSAVYAAEENYFGPDRLRWVLLTTAEVTDFISARAVVLGYTTRWLIEDLHRAWKRGWTNIERTQLRRRNSICKWATLHLALASRALRLARLARTEPDHPSIEEFSHEEIQAILLLNRRSRRLATDGTPRLADIVLLLAELGGYDRYSKKPAGPTVIGRGLTRIASLAEGLIYLKDPTK